jgi:hypothetical protein
VCDGRDTQGPKRLHALSSVITATLCIVLLWCTGQGVHHPVLFCFLIFTPSVCLTKSWSYVRVNHGAFLSLISWGGSCVASLVVDQLFDSPTPASTSTLPSHAGATGTPAAATSLSWLRSMTSYTVFVGVLGVTPLSLDTVAQRYAIPRLIAWCH